MSTALCYSFQGLVGNLLAVRDIQSLEAHCILGKSKHGAIRYRVQTGHVQGKETPIALKHSGETEVGEFGAVGQGQSLDSVAVRQGLQCTIADLGRLWWGLANMSGNEH